MKASQIPADIVGGDPCCDNCDFYLPIARGRDRRATRGQCHRFPPPITLSSSRNMWPEVTPEQWCGEYEQTDDE